MNQDVWIYKEITGLDLHVSDNVKGEIRSCGTAIDLNDDVEELWNAVYAYRFSVLVKNFSIVKKLIPYSNIVLFNGIEWLFSAVRIPQQITERPDGKKR